MTDYGNYTVLWMEKKSCPQSLDIQIFPEKMSREFRLGDSDGFHQQYHWSEHPRSNFNKSIQKHNLHGSDSTYLKVFWWAVLCRFLFYMDTSKMVCAFERREMVLLLALWHRLQDAHRIFSRAVPGHSGVRRVGICHCLRGQPFPVVVLGRLVTRGLSCFLGFSGSGEVEGEKLMKEILHQLR